jgi:hypothetical protein
MIEDNTPDGPGAESEIAVEKIDVSEEEKSPSANIDGDSIVIHPEESATVQVNDKPFVQSSSNPGYVTTRIAGPQPLPQTEPAPELPTMKYNENVFLQDALNHIIKTYGQHYANPEKQGIQVFDLWDSLGNLDTTSRDTAIKYLARYGKKGGYNKIDLFKAIHYICMLNFATQGNQ